MSGSLRHCRRRYPLLTLALLLAGTAFVLYPPSSWSQTPSAPPTPPQPAAAPTSAASFDVPLRLLAEAKQAYEKVQDYQCLFVKREQLRGQMQPENVMQMKVRARPFSVYLRWQMPKNHEGQQACYVEGKNDGQMRVHSTGLLGAVGWISMAPNDPRALQNSRHVITSAGIGNLITRYNERWEAEKPLNRTQFKVGEFEFAKRRCIRVEATHPASKPGEFYAYRSVLYFDKETKLPIRTEAYDWPKAGGDPNGDLLECFSYVNMQFNMGLGDGAFNY